MKRIEKKVMRMGKRIENKEEKKKAFKKKMRLSLVKLGIYSILVMASYIVAFKLGLYFMELLEKILASGIENITKVFYAFIILLLTKVMYAKRK